MLARPKADWRLHVAVLVGVATAHLLVRVAWQPTGFARYHLNDLLAGLALPSLLALAFRWHEPWTSWPETLKGKLALTAGATLVWEGLVPLLSSRSTADTFDALCYIGGTLAQHAMVVLVRKSRRQHVTANRSARQDADHDESEQV